MNIKPIRSEQDHVEALEESERLWTAKPGTPERDRLEVLSMLVDQYERKTYPIEAPDPIEAIKFRLEQQGLTRKALVPILGTTGRISEIMSGARSLSLEMVYRLHNELGIPYESLIKPKSRKKQHRAVTKPKSSAQRRRVADQVGSGGRRAKKHSKQQEKRAVA